MEVGNTGCLKGKKAFVVGCGGLGGFVIEHLARSGVGEITVMDGDSFTLSNLDRQLMSELGNMGENKAIAAARRIEKISDAKAIPIARFFTEENSDSIKDADVVIDCLDNIESRLLLEKKCAGQGKTLIHGALAGMVGQVAVIPPGKGILKNLYSKAHTPPIKTLSCYPAMVAAVQASEAIKFLMQKPVLTGLFIMDFESMSFDTLELF